MSETGTEPEDRASTGSAGGEETTEGDPFDVPTPGGLRVLA